MSVALVAGVFLVSILQAHELARVSFPARHSYSTFIPTMDRHKDLLRRQLVGKCQALTYLKVLQICWTVGPESSKYLPNCLCSISTRQLELLLWRARPDSPTSASYCLSQGLH